VTAGVPRPRTGLGRLRGVPTGRLVALSLVPLGLSLGVLVAPGAWIPVLALDLVLLGVALVDLLRIGADLSVARDVSAVQVVGRPFDVALRITNRAARAVRLRLTDDAPGLATGLPVQAELGPHRAMQTVYSAVVDRRGQHQFGDAIVRAASPLGLWEQQVPFEMADALRVYPDFARVRELSLRGRLSEQRVPIRARRRSGGENEFQRLRPYVSGDSYRHVDWNATARRRHLVTREFGQESNQNLIFLLDSGRMMSARSGGLTAFDHALNAAVLLGQVALKHGDRVGLLAFDRTVRAWLPPRAGKRSGGRLIRATYDLFPTIEEPDYALAFRHLTLRVRRRSLVVLLTTVVDEVSADVAERVVASLAGRHLPVTVWIRDVEVDALLDRRPTGPLDPFLAGAAAELSGWRERSLTAFERRGALTVDGTPDQLTAGLLHRYLEIKARRLL